MIIIFGGGRQHKKSLIKNIASTYIISKDKICEKYRSTCPGYFEKYSQEDKDALRAIAYFTISSIIEIIDKNNYKEICKEYNYLPSMEDENYKGVFRTLGIIK